MRFGGKDSLVGPAEPIEANSHDKTVSRYGENQPASDRFIFFIFGLHSLSPNHSSFQRFFCECD
jgi:hypothetical protein